MLWLSSGAKTFTGAISTPARPLPPWNFAVPGVTSISVDLHKYGYTAKGAGVLLHRTKRLRGYQTFVTDNWLGGVYGLNVGDRRKQPLSATVVASAIAVAPTTSAFLTRPSLRMNAPLRDPKLRQRQW